MVQVAIMGYGTIGSGVAEILAQNAEQIKHGCGQDVALKYVLDLRDFPGSPVEDRIVHDFSVIEKDPEVSVVVETMGGLNPAYPFVKASLLAGKHVVTSNKALVAAYGTELLAIAREKNVNFFFEASVGGGIPIIRPLYRCLKGEKILEITGILNGTTNFILTKMDKEGASFEAVLKEAQDLGYAERNPEADVEGYDACRKIAILSSLAYGAHVDYRDVYTEGITKITAADIAYAKEFDSVIKLLGVARNTPEGIEVGVYPVMIARDHPLASVRDSFNAVFIHGDAVDDAMFYGRGAGEMPTASAVVGDVIDEARNIEYGCSGRISCTCYQQLAVKDFGDVKNKFFLRMQVENCPGVLAQIAKVFGEHKVSIARVVQKNAKTDRAELVIVTEKVKEKHMGSALCELKEMKSIFEVSSMIREY